jgi:hypothetical protein
MTPRLIVAALALLSLTGCVAALPLAVQLASGANSTAQLCSMAKMPGQTASLCDRFSTPVATQPPAAAAVKTPHKALNATTVDTAAR